MGIGDGDARFLTRVFGDLLPVSRSAAGLRLDPDDVCLPRPPLFSSGMTIPERVCGLGRWEGIAASAFLGFWSLDPEGPRVTVPPGSWRLYGLASPLTTAPTKVALWIPDEIGRLPRLTLGSVGDGFRAGGMVNGCCREVRCAACLGISPLGGTGSTGLPGLDFAQGRLDE